MSLFHKYVPAWDLDEDPHVFLARTQAGIERETRRQACLEANGTPIPQNERESLSIARERVALVRRTTAKDKTE